MLWSCRWGESLQDGGLDAYAFDATWSQSVEAQNHGVRFLVSETPMKSSE